MAVSRGVRNSNPGSLDYNPRIHWQGLLGIEDPPPDGAPAGWHPRFCKFDAPENGIRAIAKVLLHYYGEGKTTVREMLTTYAPGIENDTEAYIDDVAESAGVGPDDDLQLGDDSRRLTGPHVLPPLVEAIIRHENREPGVPWVSPYDASTVQGAIDSALA